MPAWVYSSPGEDNGFDRCWGKTELEKEDGWFYEVKTRTTLLSSEWLPDGNATSSDVLHFETIETYGGNM